MSGAFWCLVSLVSAYAPAPEAPKPGNVVLLAETAEYRSAKPAELIYEGVVQRNPGSGKIGVRFPPFRLALQDGAGQPVLHVLHAVSQAHLLAAQVGQRVRIVGKLCPVEVDGKTVLELWPGRLEPLTVNPTDAPGADGIYARTYWQPEEARRRGTRQYIFRNGEQLAQALMLTGASSETTATTLLAQKLRVAEIDWKKHMVVCISAGLRGADVDRLLITGAHVKDDTLTIAYCLHAPPANAGGPAGFGYPAETVLLNRFDGTVRIVEEPPPQPKPPRPTP